MRAERDESTVVKLFICDESSKRSIQSARRNVEYSEVEILIRWLNVTRLQVKGGVQVRGSDNESEHKSS